MTLIYDMDSGAGADKLGGKAAALIELRSNGFNVPPFFVISPKGFTTKGLTKDAKQDLKTAMASLKGSRFAVRSSGRAEDGVEHSHAGQFLSQLNISRGKISDSAHQVWLSG